MRAIVILLVGGKNSGDNSIQAALEKVSYGVEVVSTGAQAVKTLENKSPNLIVYNAPAMRSSGVRTCRRLRRTVPETPIVHIRAAGVREDRDAEADVYLEQPFTSRKLLNRVRFLLPADEDNEEIVRYGKVTLYLSKRSVEVTGRGESKLTPKVAHLLEELMRHPDEVVTRKQLMQTVWQTDYVGDTRTLDVHVRWARELVEADPSKPEYLITKRGQGYIFTMLPPDQRSA